MQKKVQKRRRIRRKRGSGPRNMYFTMETQEAIQEIQRLEKIEAEKEEDLKDQKHKVYVDKVQPAFEKLVENLIFVYGFHSPLDTFHDMKSDCVSFLYESMHKWNPERGTKAFSYFNVVAKNWLIIRSRKQKKRVKRHISADNPEGMTMLQREMYESHDVIPPPDELLINRNLRNEIQNLLNEIQGIVTSESEKSCINAVIVVFKNIDELDFLNKRAILVYVREISGLSPKQLSVAMSSIRKHYRRLTGATGEFNLF